VLSPVDNNYDITAHVGDELGPYTFVNTDYATKSGIKWQDLNEDGVRNTGEPIISGWSIMLLDSTGAVVAIDITDENGMYEFDTVMPGETYLVCEEDQLYWEQTYPNNTTPDPNPPKTTIAACPVGYGPYGYEITLESGDEDTGNNFGNYRTPGCTLTQGYWKTHSYYGPAPYDDGWLLIGDVDGNGFEQGQNELFFDSVQTWYQTFQTKVKAGNAYYILAHQYMAAMLNIMNGADPTVLSSGSGNTLAEAEALLDKWDTLGPLTIPRNHADRVTAIQLADTLDDFNNGILAGGPPHCTDSNVETTSLKLDGDSLITLWRPE
jgi:hypothetical protein